MQPRGLLVPLAFSDSFWVILQIPLIPHMNDEEPPLSRRIIFFPLLAERKTLLFGFLACLDIPLTWIPMLVF